MSQHHHRRDPGATALLVASQLPAASSAWIAGSLSIAPRAPSQIVFIDGAVPDAQMLAMGVKAGMTAVVLDPNGNELQQVADDLANHDIKDLAAIDIVAHGSDGELMFGSNPLDAATIPQYAGDLAAIGAALRPGGAIQLYGCDVAQDATGVAFLQQLSQATGGASIAAASHLVGAAADGGNWDLNVDVGTVDAASPFTAAATAAYPDLLGTASDLVWYLSEASTTSGTGVYTVEVDGSGAATNQQDIESTPTYGFTAVDGFAIDPSAGVYFVANYFPSGPNGDTNQIVEGNINGSGTPSVIYTSGNSGGDAIVGLEFDQLNGLLYMAVTDYDIPTTNETTGIYTIIALGTGTRAASELVVLNSGTQAPNDIAVDTTHNLLFYTNGVPGLSGVEEVGVANLTTGSIINSGLVSYSASGNVEPYGIAVDPATDTLYWTTVNFSANAGNAIDSATYSTGASVTLSNTQTLATTSLAQVPIGIGLDIPAGGYYVDTSTGVSNDTTPDEILFGSSLTTPETLTSVYSVPDQDGGTETLPTEAIVVESQPTVAASGAVTYDQGHPAIAVDPSATVSDASGYYLASATVSIASGLGSGDTLSFTAQDGITGAFVSGTLTLTGAEPAADYQVVLDSVTFSTTSTSATPRTIDWTVGDGVVDSTTPASTVDVHVAPTVTAGGTVTFTGGGAAVKLDSGLNVTDASSTTLNSATVMIGTGYTGGDTLNFVNTAHISGVFSNGVLTLAGADTVADYKTALESITYSFTPSNGDPTEGNTDTSRTISWVVNDGVVSSATADSTLNTVHAAPTITTGGSVTYDAGGVPLTLDAGLSVSDPDSNGTLNSATVSIGSGFLSGDTLEFVNQNGIAGSYDVSSGVLTLSGVASLPNYATALESVTYSFSGDPSDGGTDPGRTIDWQVNDGILTSAGAASTLVVQTPPGITAGASVTFVLGGPPVTLDSGIAVNAPDSGGTLASATVSVFGDVAGSGDVLTATTASTAITASYDPNDGTLTLAGNDTVADYVAVLDSVSFSAIQAGSRTIDWQVNDGVLSSAVATSSVGLLQRPTVEAGGTVTYDAGGAAATLNASLLLSDPDSSFLVSATVTIGTGFRPGDTLNFVDQNGITGSFDPLPGMLTLSGSASLADYQSALESVTYSFAGDPTDGGTDTSRAISWTVSDNSLTSAVAASTLVVQTPPGITAGAAVTYVLGDPPVTLDSGIAVNAPESGSTLANATISVFGDVGSSGDVLAATTAGTAITASYDPNDATLTLAGTDTVADYLAVLDSVTFSAIQPGSRTIDWQVNDGVLSSGTATSSVGLQQRPTVEAGGTVTYDAGGEPVTLNASLLLFDPDSSFLASATVTIGTGFRPGDTLNFVDQNGITGSFDPLPGMLTLSGSASLAAYQSALESVTYSFAGDPSAGGTDPGRTIDWQVNDGILASPLATSSLTTLCFCAGTRIATPDGEMPVEALRPGDMVRLADGGAAPVRWMGQRVVARRFADPLRDWPIRVRAGALADGVPRRDLLLSPGHALRVGDVLAHAAALVNGSSIVRERQVPENFVYWHVELDTHALILAEGTPAESFLDACEDVAFDNRSGRPPAPDATELPYPRCKSPRQLPSDLRAALAARAAPLAPPGIAA